MAMVADNQQRRIRLLLHDLANVCIHGDIHISDHMLILVWAGIFGVVGIAMPPEIMLDTVRRGKVREQHIDIFVFHRQPG